MKKLKRLFALCLPFVLLCLCTTGCNAIDEMRAHHGVYAENGNVIIMGETQYRRLPHNEYLAATNASPDRIYVTDKDVPVLLSDMLGAAFRSYNDGLLLQSSAYGEERYYCRTDKYDELAARLEEGFNPTGYCYRYTKFNAETQEFTEHTYLLTKEEEEAIRYVLANVEGVARDEYARYDNDFSITLYAYSDDMLLQKYAYTIERTFNSYYLVEYDNAMDIAYTVPYNKYTVFDAICKSKLEADKIEDDYYYDLYGYDEDKYDIDYEVA